MIDALRRRLQSEFPARFDRRMRRSKPPRPPAELYLLADRSRIRVARANYLAVQGSRDEAAVKLAHVIASRRGTPGAIPSLGVLVSGDLSEETARLCWSAAGGRRALLNLSSSPLADHFPLFAVLVEMGLAADEEQTRAFVEEVYVHRMQQEECLRRPSGRTILFWHVPKCAGTAFNNCLAHAFYRSGTRCLPSYTARRFLQLLLSEYRDVFPYLSSAHLRRHELLPPEGLYQALSIRNPVERAISAWRQYYRAPEKRLEILPQHGCVWDFWPTAGLAEWAGRAPPEVVNRQTATFSPTLDPEEAARRIAEIDVVFDMADIRTAAEEIARKFELPLDFGLLETRKNVTKKTIAFQADEVEVLRSRLSPDLTMFHQVATT